VAILLVTTVLQSSSSLCTGITSTLVRSPLNEAIEEGSAVTFQCSIRNVNSSLIQWFNSTCVTTTRSVGRCRDDLIYTGVNLVDNFRQRFDVTMDDNATHVTRDLDISSTQLTDAGVYLCTERIPGVAKVTDSGGAQLIVLGNYDVV